MNISKFSCCLSVALLAALGQSSALAHTVHTPVGHSEVEHMGPFNQDNHGNAIFDSTFAHDGHASQRGHEEDEHARNASQQNHHDGQDDLTFVDASGKHEHSFKGSLPHGLTHPFGRPDGCNVSPVPVPAAAWLLGSGLVTLTGLARRRRS